MKFMMPIGIPGSGKSTFAKTLSGTYLSSDDLRDELGKINIWDEMKKRAEDALSRGEDVIYDATNLKRHDRKVALAIAKRYGAETIAYVLSTPIDVCFERNKQRRKERIVPEEVIIRMNESFEPPFSGEFDKVVNVK